MFDSSHIAIPLEEYDNLPLDALLNHAACPICGARLHWNVSVMYNSECNKDFLVFESNCCGKLFNAEMVFNDCSLSETVEVKPFETIDL